jgi:hypothetical protein
MIDLNLNVGDSDVIRFDVSTASDVEVTLADCISGPTSGILVKPKYQIDIPCNGKLTFNSNVIVDELIDYVAVPSGSNYYLNFDELELHYAKDTSILLNDGIVDLSNYDFEFEVYGISGDTRAKYISKTPASNYLLENGIIIFNLDSDDTLIEPSQYTFYVTLKDGNNHKTIVEGNFYINEK